MKWREGPDLDTSCWQDLKSWEADLNPVFKAMAILHRNARCENQQNLFSFSPLPFHLLQLLLFFQGKFNGSCAFMRSHSSHDSYTCPQAAIWLTSGGLGSERIGPGQWCMGLSPLWHQLHRGCLVFVILN